jgi:hypothetical protein
MLLLCCRTPPCLKRASSLGSEPQGSACQRSQPELMSPCSPYTNRPCWWLSDPSLEVGAVWGAIGLPASLVSRDVYRGADRRPMSAHLPTECLSISRTPLIRQCGFSA